MNDLSRDPTHIVDSALQWAQDRLGDTKYAGLCYAFVEDAYELGGDIVLDGQGTTAKEAADAYLARDHTAGPPPRGAYVFYDCSGPIHGEIRTWGHVGLSLGDGQVVHAWDVVRLDGYLDLQNIDPAPGWTSAVYLGWAPVDIILKGSRLNQG